MNPIHANPIDNEPSPAEVTLRLIARLPAPEGLEDRVHGALKAAPAAARILAWPASFQPAAGWMRGAAAAAIVFVVAGGGWGVYTRVQPSQPAKVVVTPLRTGTTSGFSSAAAVRTPQTLNGPVVTQPVMANHEQVKTPTKISAQKAPTPLHRSKSDAAAEVAVRPGALPAN